MIVPSAAAPLRGRALGSRLRGDGARPRTNMDAEEKKQFLQCAEQTNSVALSSRANYTD
jgi:hypothetical protein